MSQERSFGPIKVCDEEKGWVWRIAAYPKKNTIFTLGYPPSGGKSLKLQRWGIISQKQLSSEVVVEKGAKMEGHISLVKFDDDVLLLVVGKDTEEKLYSLRVTVFQVSKPDEEERTSFEIKIHCDTGVRYFGDLPTVWNLPHENDMFCVCTDGEIHLISLSKQEVIEKRKFVRGPKCFIPSRVHPKCFYVKFRDYTKGVQFDEVALFNYEEDDLQKSLSVYDSERDWRILFVDVIEVYKGEESVLVCRNKKDNKGGYECRLIDSETKEDVKTITFEKLPVECLKNRFLFFKDGKMYDFKMEEFYDFGSGFAPEETVNRRSFRLTEYTQLLGIIIFNRNFISLTSHASILRPPTVPTRLSCEIQVSQVEGSEDIIFDDEGEEDFLERLFFVQDLMTSVSDDTRVQELKIFIGGNSFAVFKSFLC